MALEDECAWLNAGQATSRSDIDELRPHFLLVEVADPREMDEQRITELVSFVRAEGSAAVLWLTEIANAALCPFSIRSLFDVVFCTDPGLHLKGARDSMPGTIGLPHAASRGALLAERTPSAEGVGLIVEPSAPWSTQFSTTIEPLITAAAEHPFFVLSMEPQAPGLPKELEPLARTGSSDEQRIAFIRERGVIVTGSPSHASASFMPAVVFDSVALGVPVMVARPASGTLILQRVVGLTARATPRRRSTTVLGFNKWLETVRTEDADRARELIATALADGEFSPGCREAGRASVRHEHTYVHRLITAASAVGIAVMDSVS